MTPERWQQVKLIFDEARERAPEGRAVFLDEVCAADTALRREVESLLAAHEQTGGFIDEPAIVEKAKEMAARQEDLPPGQRLGPYEVMRKLGQGGIGAVYLARDTRLGRPIALKLLQSHLTQDAERVRRFRQEARAVSALNHPNILTIYEVGEIDGLNFIATEFIDGRTLREVLHGNQINLGEALEIVIQVAQALEAAHQAGIVHRDIKPENLMRRADGYVKVLDFGLAKLTERSKFLSAIADNFATMHSRHDRDGGFVTMHTQPGMIMGTVTYMSPEQTRGFEVDGRTDIFSLGVVLYELLTGCSPFAGQTASDIIAAIIGKEPAPLASHLRGLPDELQRIVSRALEKELDARYQTIAELLLDLRGLKQELELSAKLKDSGPTKSGEKPPLNMLVGAAPPTAPAVADVSGDAAHRATVATNEAALRRTGDAQNFFVWLSQRRATAALTLAVLVLVIFAFVLADWGRAERNAAINSIAILPFNSVATDPQMEYLPDGITESIIQSLSQLPALRVMARSTVFTYKDREVDPRQVGAALRVRAVVTGRVLRQGERLVIRVELVDASDGARLWGEQYERPLADILTVQEEIAREISDKLRLRLSGEQRQQLAKRYTANSEAYQLYLKGRYQFLQFNRASQEKALAYFQQAVALDPNYALAYTGIADVYADFSSQYLPPGEAMPKAKEAALKALAIDDQLAEARYSLATIKWFGDWDWTGAEREFKRALELNPNAGTTYSFYADFLLDLKRFDEALTSARRGYELDPLSPHASEMVSKALFYLRQYDQSIEQSRKTLELHPEYLWARGNLVRNLLIQGRYAEAVAELRQQLKTTRHDAYTSELGYVYAVTGQTNDARRILTELEAEARQRPVSPVYLARIYTGLGDKERALALLQRAYGEHSDHLLSLGINPIFDSLRTDERFIALVRGIGLAQ